MLKHPDVPSNAVVYRRLAAYPQTDHATTKDLLSWPVFLLYSPSSTIDAFSVRWSEMALVCVILSNKRNVPSVIDSTKDTWRFEGKCPVLPEAAEELRPPTPPLNDKIEPTIRANHSCSKGPVRESILRVNIPKLVLQQPRLILDSMAEQKPRPLLHNRPTYSFALCFQHTEFQTEILTADACS